MFMSYIIYSTDYTAVELNPEKWDKWSGFSAYCILLKNKKSEDDPEQNVAEI